MALPIIAGIAASKLILGSMVALGASGAALTAKGAVDTVKANSTQKEAETILYQGEMDFLEAKNKTELAIQGLGQQKATLLSKEIMDFVTVFSKLKDVELADSEGINELHKLNITKTELNEMQVTSMDAINLLSSVGAGVGSGLLLGYGTYGGAMALGTASTGTVIGTLHGVAATNATMAWLGGGSLASGGGGMALGTTVLGGLVLGPALLIGGGVFATNAKGKCDNAHSNLAQSKKIMSDYKTAITRLDIIVTATEDLSALLEKLVLPFQESLCALTSLVEENNDYKQYSKDENAQVAITVEQALLLKSIVDTPLLTEDGLLHPQVNALLSPPT